MTRSIHAGFWARLRRHQGGAAAVEFALWAVALTATIYNAVDVSLYGFQKMQVEAAAQAAAHGVWSACNTSADLPATKNCAAMLTAAVAGARSTSLGGKVQVSSGWPIEGYYCVNGSAALQQVGTVATPGAAPTPPSPFNCSSVTPGSTTAPGDYVQVRVSYTYTPAVAGLSVISLLPNPMTQTAWTRLN